MDRDNAEVFYSRVSDIEDLFYCLSHQLRYIITGEEHPSVQMQHALELSNACVTLVQAALYYREEHKDWYPSPEGLITWNSQPVVRSGIWTLASSVMELLREPGAADMPMKSNLWSQLEGLTDMLLEGYMGLLTAKFERGEEHGGLVQEYCERRDELLGSLYDLAKQIIEAKYQVFSNPCHYFLNVFLRYVFIFYKFVLFLYLPVILFIVIFESSYSVLHNLRKWCGY
jgi:nuclear pore complex protein Nup133